MKKRMLSIMVSLVLVLTGMNINIDKVDAASKDPNYEYMTFLIMGRFTAYPTQSGSSLQATWNSGSGARTNPVSLGQKVDIHVGSGDGASPNLIPAEDVSKWQIEYVGEYDNAPYGFEWGVDNNYHNYPGWLDDESKFLRHYLNYAPNDFNFKNYSLDKKGNIVFDLSMTLNQRGDKAYNYFSKLRYEYEPPSILWDYWGGKSELQNSDPLFAKEVQRALDNYNKTSWDGYIFPYPFVVVLKRPIAAEGITYEGYFLENGTMIKPYEDTKHQLDVATPFEADDIAGYELVGSKQQYETAPTGAIKKGVSSYNITWKKILNGFNFRKNYIHYYYKPVDSDPGSDTPPPKFTYTSVPKSYGEIKEGTYSASRSSERWNAMAGFPHDSTLFTDVGASYMSVDLATDTKWAETDNSPSSHDVSGKGTHNTRSCPDGCGGSYCINGGCPNSGNDCSPCSGHQVQTGVDSEGKPTYKTEYRDHRHGRCGTSPERWTESFPVVQSFDVKAHKIGSYDIKTPMKLNANIPYVQEDVNIKQNEQVKAIEKEATWDEVKGLTKSLSGYKCYEESRFSNDAFNKIKNEYNANKSYFSYNPPSFVAEGLSQSLEFLEQTKAKFVQTNTVFNGMLAYKPQYLKSGIPQTQTNFKYWEITTSNSMNNYKTNFIPELDNWSSTSEVPYVGYDGSYNSYGRRGGDRALFYKAGLSIVPYGISNGSKETGIYDVEFITTDSRGAEVNAFNYANATYSENHDKVNDVIVHSPISISKLEIIPKTALSDQRVDSQKSDLQRINPDSAFSVVFHTTWTGTELITSPAISELTGKTGKGYKYGIQTEQWIKYKAISFPYEVISLWDNVRHKKNEIIKLDKNKSIYEFYLPVSEKEMSSADIKGYLEANNNLNQEIDFKTWNSLNEARYKNIVEDYDYAADHFVTRKEKVDIVGRIGNFEISYCDSDDFETYFTKLDPNKPRIKNVWYYPKTPYEYNKYAATPKDIFGREGLVFGFDRYGAIPRISKKANDVLPVQGDMVGHRMFNRYVPQLGQHLFFSFQSIGNYNQNNSRMAIVPKYKILSKKTGKITDVGDIWIAKGANYYKAFPRNNQASEGQEGYVSKEAMSVSGIKLRLQDSRRFLSPIEKGRTRLIEPEIFKNDEYILTGNMGRLTLGKDFRTFVGGFVSESYNTNPGYSDGSIRTSSKYSSGLSLNTDSDHSKQAQRWHGSLWLPSSSTFIEKGKTFTMSGDEIDTTDCVLLVSLYIQSLDGETYNLSTDLKEFNGDPQLRVYTKADNTYVKTLNLPKDTVAVFDLDERSNDKITTQGIL